MLTQLGAGGEVSSPIVRLVRLPCTVVVSTPTTRMSPAGMPRAFTVTDPSREMPVCVVIRWPRRHGGRRQARATRLDRHQDHLLVAKLTEPGVCSRYPGLLVDRERDRAVGVLRYRVGRGSAPARAGRGSARVRVGAAPGEVGRDRLHVRPVQALELARRAIPGAPRPGFARLARCWCSLGHVSSCRTAVVASRNPRRPALDYLPPGEFMAGSWKCRRPGVKSICLSGRTGSG